MQLAKTLRSAFRRDRTAALAKRSRQRLALESLEQRIVLNGDPIKINFLDLTRLAAPNTVYIGGWINGGHEVASPITEVAIVQIGSGVSSSPPTPMSSPELTITPNNAVYYLDQSAPAHFIIGGTGFGSVPSANIITFYEDASGTTVSPVNPKGPAGPFYFSIIDGNDTSLTVGFNTDTKQQPNKGPLYAKINSSWAHPLQADGTFATHLAPSVPFYDVASLLASGVSLSQSTNGNDRLFFTVVPSKPAPTSSAAQWGNFPINVLPSNTATVPPGPYGFLEFGYNAQFNTSYVDFFGLNWSFVDDAVSNVVYGVLPTVSRSQIQSAFTTFTQNDPLGSDFSQLLWTTSTNPPAPVESQFTAIVAPKDWLAQYTPPLPTAASNLANYWNETVDEFFSSGNKLNITFGGNDYSGTSDGEKYTLTSTTEAPFVIRKDLYNSVTANAPAIFVQGQTDGSAIVGQIKDSIFEAFSRGVALDGVWNYASAGSPPSGYSSNAWTDYTNWYIHGATTYDSSIMRTYDVYAKFFHYSTVSGADFRSVPNSKPMFGLNPAGYFAMAYGFSLDESPSVNTDPALKFKDNNWPANATVNGGTTINRGGSITVTFGPWGDPIRTSLAVVSGDFNGDGLTDICELLSTGQWEAAFTPVSGPVTTVNVGAPWVTAGITWSDFSVVHDAITNRDVVIARASNEVDGSWWKLAYDETSWSTTFVGSWGIQDTWVDIVVGDFDGNASQDIAGRNQATGEWWMLQDAAAMATDATYAAKNVQIGQWNPLVTFENVVAGGFDKSGTNAKDLIAGRVGTNWWLLTPGELTPATTPIVSGFATDGSWVDAVVGNFNGGTDGEQIAVRHSTSGQWHTIAYNGSTYAASRMVTWSTEVTWSNVVVGNFSGDATGAVGIAGRENSSGNWYVVQRQNTYQSVNFGGAWPTTSVWAQAFAGIYTPQAESPKKFGILGRSLSSAGNPWEKAISSGTAFTSSAAPGYPA